MSLTNGVYGAGVPAGTAHTSLIYSIQSQRADLDKLRFISGWVARHDFKAVAAWEIGSCRQHRQILYTLCHHKGENVAGAAWRIFDRDDVNLEHYDSLAYFLEHETEVIEECPGGHQQEHIIPLDRCP